MSFFLSVLGVVLIFEGMPWFLSPEKTKILLAKMQALPSGKLRLFGLAVMLAGLVLVRISL